MAISRLPGTLFFVLLAALGAIIGSVTGGMVGVMLQAFFGGPFWIAACVITGTLDGVVGGFGYPVCRYMGEKTRIFFHPLFLAIVFGFLAARVCLGLGLWITLGMALGNALIGACLGWQLRRLNQMRH